MPIERKPAKISNQQFLNALLYTAENGCDGGRYQKSTGSGIRYYVRFNRWSKNGTILRIFEELQKQNIISIQSEVLCLDNTSIKVHPDAAGTKKTNGEQSLVKNGKFEGGLFACKISLCSRRIWARLACRGSRPKRG